MSTRRLIYVYGPITETQIEDCRNESRAEGGGRTQNEGWRVHSMIGIKALRADSIEYQLGSQEQQGFNRRYSRRNSNGFWLKIIVIDWESIRKRNQKEERSERDGFELKFMQQEDKLSHSPKRQYLSASEEKVKRLIIPPSA